MIGAVLLLLAQSLLHVRVSASDGTLTRPVECGAFVTGKHYGAALSFEWDFGDGAALTTAQPIVRHQYAAPGAYQVSVVVRDTSRADQLAASEPIHAIVRER